MPQPQILEKHLKATVVYLNLCWGDHVKALCIYFCLVTMNHRVLLWALREWKEDCHDTMEPHVLEITQPFICPNSQYSIHSLNDRLYLKCYNVLSLLYNNPWYCDVGIEYFTVCPLLCSYIVILC